MFSRIIRPHDDILGSFFRNAILKTKIEKIVKNKKLSDDKKVELIMKEINSKGLLDIVVY